MPFEVKAAAITVQPAGPSTKPSPNPATQPLAKAAGKALAAGDVKVLQALCASVKVNSDKLNEGMIFATVTRSIHEDNGGVKDYVVRARAALRDKMYRLDLGDNDEVIGRPRQRRIVSTPEECRYYGVGETTAYSWNPDCARDLSGNQPFLPFNCPAFWHVCLKKAADSKAVESLKVRRLRAEDGNAIRVEVVLKSEPKNLYRYTIDPNRGAAIVGYQSLHDFGSGYVLLGDTKCDMQRTNNGAWYLKRMTERRHGMDGKITMETKCTIQSCSFGEPVADSEFEWSGMGVPEDATIVDQKRPGR